jgi:2,3-bisphosphoglycerate-independent phosphoglycerate mutase
MRDVKGPGLSNVAATLLNLLGYEKPGDYDPSLVHVG